MTSPEANPVQGLTAFIKTLGVARIAAMGAVTVTLIGFFAFLMMRVTAPQMVPLFTDLSLTESGAVVKDLERQAVQRSAWEGLHLETMQVFAISRQPR